MPGAPKGPPIGRWKRARRAEVDTSAEDDDFDILHVDSLDFAKRQKVLEKNQVGITSRQIDLESLIRDLTKIVITSFTELRQDLRLTPYVRRLKGTTGPTTVPSAIVTIEIPPVGAIVVGPSSTGAPVSTLDPTLLTTQSTDEEAAQIELVVACSLIDRGVRSTGGPGVGEAAARRRLAEGRTHRKGREAGRKDPKGKSIAKSTQDEDESD
ncbi:hypothetical protein LWI28_016137 [Acer negundo]|uniref:Uncharacterized protein n=1 Tax=Acer negundo TaxID=4023 RepID=A0AAD5I6Z8_ACENE|nr:hypothetical protein LWI28_016137 [Acer negundo]